MCESVRSMKTEDQHQAHQCCSVNLYRRCVLPRGLLGTCKYAMPELTLKGQLETPPSRNVAGCAYNEGKSSAAAIQEGTHSLARDLRIGESLSEIFRLVSSKRQMTTGNSCARRGAYPMQRGRRVRNTCRHTDISAFVWFPPPCLFVKFRLVAMAFWLLHDGR